MNTIFLTLLVLFATGAFSPLSNKMADVRGETAPVAMAAEGDVISWDKTVHNFGDVLATDGPLGCTFTLTNKGTEPIAIFEVVSSCGCTDVKWTRERIQPGQTGTISATYKNEDGPMAFDKTLTVYISGVKKPVILRLRGVVHEKKKSLAQLYGAEKLGTFGMKTRSFQAGTLKQGLSISQTETVANLGTRPLKVEFTDVSKCLSIRVTPNPIPAGSAATLSYTVKADPQVYGKAVYKATPVLDGKKASAQLEILAYTQENFASWTDAQRKNAALPYFDQSTFSMGVVRDNAPVEVVFQCTNRGKSALHFYNADTDSAALQLKEMSDIDSGKKGTVRFTLNPSLLNKGETVIMISLTTNSPLRPVINLFVAGEIR